MKYKFIYLRDMIILLTNVSDYLFRKKLILFLFANR